MISSSDVFASTTTADHFPGCQILQPFAVYKCPDNVRLGDDLDHSSVRSCDRHSAEFLGH